MTRPRFMPDDFTLALMFVVIAASIFPCEGQIAVVFDRVTMLAIGLLFSCTVPNCRVKQCLQACVTGACT